MPILAVEVYAEGSLRKSWDLTSERAANHSAVVRTGALGDGIVIPYSFSTDVGTGVPRLFFCLGGDWRGGDGDW